MRWKNTALEVTQQVTRGHREGGELEEQQPLVLLLFLLLLLPQRLKYKHAQCGRVQPAVTVSTGLTAGEEEQDTFCQKRTAKQ